MGYLICKNCELYYEVNKDFIDFDTCEKCGEKLKYYDSIDDYYNEAEYLDHPYETKNKTGLSNIKRITREPWFNMSNFYFGNRFAPVTWQGWLVMITYCIILLTMYSLVHHNLIIFLIFLLIIITTYLIILIITSDILPYGDEESVDYIELYRRIFKNRDHKKKKEIN